MGYIENLKAQAEQAAKATAYDASVAQQKDAALATQARNIGRQEGANGLAQELLMRQQQADETAKQAQLRQMYGEQQYMNQVGAAQAYDPRDMQGTMGLSPSQQEIDAELARRANAAAAYRGTK